MTEHKHRPARKQVYLDVMSISEAANLTQKINKLLFQIAQQDGVVEESHFEVIENRYLFARIVYTLPEGAEIT